MRHVSVLSVGGFVLYLEITNRRCQVCFRLVLGPNIPHVPVPRAVPAAHAQRAAVRVGVRALRGGRGRRAARGRRRARRRRAGAESLLRAAG